MGLDFNSKPSKMVFRFKNQQLFSRLLLTMILTIFCCNLKSAFSFAPVSRYFLHTQFPSVFSFIPSFQCLTCSIKLTWFSIHILPHLWHLVLAFSPEVSSSINQPLHYYYAGIRYYTYGWWYILNYCNYHKVLKGF